MGITYTQPQGLTLKTFTLGAQGIFNMCFVQYMSQKKRESFCVQRQSNGFVTETKRVYCAVRTETLNVIRVALHL